MDLPRIFHPLSIQQERDILIHDDEVFSRTRSYIEPLILSAIRRIPEEGRRNQTFRNLMAQIPIAAKRYLENPAKEEHKFSTYFTWYIHEEFKASRPRR